jgi:hypothetical protein
LVTVLELEAGSGQFGFLLARALMDAVVDDEPGALPRFRYLMTDVGENNVRSWMTHPRLKPLVETGLMEFAVLDAGAPADARLVLSGKSMAETLGGDPVGKGKEKVSKKGVGQWYWHIFAESKGSNIARKFRMYMGVGS